MLGVGITDVPPLAPTGSTAPADPPNPSVLFAGAEAGFWFDPSDPATRFQDSAGLIPAGDGDPLGRLSDKSGNINHATQSVTAARPQLHATPGLHYLANDGSDDDGLVLDTGVMVRDFYCAIQYQDGTATSFGNFHTVFTTASRGSSAGRCMGRSGGTDLFGSSFAAGVNGAPVTGDTLLPLPWGIVRIQAADQSLFEVGAMFGANFNNITRQWVGRFAPLLAIDRVLTPSEDASLRAYFAPRIGTPV